MIKKILLVLFLVFCETGKALSFPTFTGQVVDEAGILTDQQKSQLTEILQQAQPHQVVAVSLKSLDGKEIEEYGYQLGRHWGIGRKGVDDGILILIAPNQGRLRIEVGYGLEHILTDAKSSVIIHQSMLPLAKQGKYGEALIQGARAVLQTLNGQEMSYAHNAIQSSKQESDYNSITNVIIIWAVLITVLVPVGNVLHAKLKDYKSKSWQNRLLFFYENLLLANIFKIPVAVFIIWPLLHNTLICCLVVPLLLYLLNRKEIQRWRKNREFPYHREFLLHSGRGHNSGHNSGGGSSFSGGGGSFGGGGASGRF